MTDLQGPIVWIAGVGWDDLTGTDKRIVLELGRLTDVLWVDSPRRGGWSTLRAARRGGEEVAPGVQRLSIPGIPGFSRWPFRLFTRATTSSLIRRVVGTKCRVRAVVVANPMGRFPTKLIGHRVLYMTDDWIAGASLMGLCPRSIRRALERTAREADLIAGVSPELVKRASSLRAPGPVPTIVLPNGAPPVCHPSRVNRVPVAGVVGTLNERLDLSVLESVVAAGIRLHLIGPRADRDPGFGQRLDRLAAQDLVEWTDQVPSSDLCSRTGILAVGLTPYTDTAFNRASFPLKTFDYLAAGVPVVSTDLPASRWIGSECVETTKDTASFVSAVQRQVEKIRIGEVSVEHEETRCRELARAHSWERRAEKLLESIDGLNCRTSEDNYPVRGIR